MKKLKLILSATIILLLQSNFSSAQGLAVNTTGAAADASAMLDVNSTSQGVLVPRMTAAQRGLISNPATGLLVYQTDATAGFYFYNGTQWTSLNGGSTTPAVTAQHLAGASYSISTTDELVYSTTAGASFTLPSAAAAGLGKVIYIADDFNAVGPDNYAFMNIYTTGSDQILMPYYGPESSSVGQVMFCMLISDGVSNWVAVSAY